MFYRKVNVGWRKNLLACEVSTDDGVLRKYAKAAEIDSVEWRLARKLRKTLRTRFLQLKRSKTGDNQVIASFSLLNQDGTPHYIGVLRQVRRGKHVESIRVVIGQRSGERVSCRKFNLAKYSSARDAFFEAVICLCDSLELNALQQNTLMDSWPAFRHKFDLG